MSKAKRPTISLSAQTYAKIKAYCELNGISMAGFVEERIDEYLNSQPEDLLGTPAEVATMPNAAARPPVVPVSVAQEMYRIAHRRGERP